MEGQEPPTKVAKIQNNEGEPEKAPQNRQYCNYCKKKPSETVTIMPCTRCPRSVCLKCAKKDHPVEDYLCKFCSATVTRQREKKAAKEAQQAARKRALELKKAEKQALAGLAKARPAGKKKDPYPIKDIALGTKNLHSTELSDDLFEKAKSLPGIDCCLSGDILQVWDTLIRFGNLIELSPFELEAFVQALALKKDSTLMNEIHMQLWKFLLLEYYPSEDDEPEDEFLQTEAINSLTWYELTRRLLNVEISNSFADAAPIPAALREIVSEALAIKPKSDETDLLKKMSDCEYAELDEKSRIQLLKFFCDRLYELPTIRHEIKESISQMEHLQSQHFHSTRERNKAKKALDKEIRSIKNQGLLKNLISFKKTEGATKRQASLEEADRKTLTLMSNQLYAAMCGGDPEDLRAAIMEGRHAGLETGRGKRLQRTPLLEKAMELQTEFEGLDNLDDQCISAQKEMDKCRIGAQLLGSDRLRRQYYIFGDDHSKLWIMNPDSLMKKSFKSKKCPIGEAHSREKLTAITYRAANEAEVKAMIKEEKRQKRLNDKNSNNNSKNNNNNNNDGKKKQTTTTAATTNKKRRVEVHHEFNRPECDRSCLPCDEGLSSDYWTNSWTFFEYLEDVEEFTESLDPRGLNERALKESVEFKMKKFKKHMLSYKKEEDKKAIEIDVDDENIDNDEEENMDIDEEHVEIMQYYNEARLGQRRKRRRTRTNIEEDEDLSSLFGFGESGIHGLRSALRHLEDEHSELFQVKNPKWENMKDEWNNLVLNGQTPSDLKCRVLELENGFHSCLYQERSESKESQESQANSIIEDPVDEAVQTTGESETNMDIDEKKSNTEVIIEKEEEKHVEIEVDTKEDVQPTNDNDVQQTNQQNQQETQSQQQQEQQQEQKKQEPQNDDNNNNNNEEKEEKEEEENEEEEEDGEEEEEEEEEEEVELKMESKKEVPDALWGTVSIRDLWMELVDKANNTSALCLAVWLLQDACENRNLKELAEEESEESEEMVSEDDNDDDDEMDEEDEEVLEQMSRKRRSTRVYANDQKKKVEKKKEQKQKKKRQLRTRRKREEMIEDDEDEDEKPKRRTRRNLRTRNSDVSYNESQLHHHETRVHKKVNYCLDSDSDNDDDDDNDNDEEAYEEQQRCEECGEGGKLLICESCEDGYHVKCVGLRRAPVKVWLCDKCKSGEKNDSDSETDQHDDLCNVCEGSEGDLITCEGCPHVFHAGCLGLDEIPEDDYFCEECMELKCGKCNKSQIKMNGHIICGNEDGSKGCSKVFHLSCAGLESVPEEDWFCEDCL